ncbi:MAG: hypothetical protein QOG64_2937 [Acidimicrobiaceae bacterium]|jgi:hypothetical protein|nr:hypothetical protein [Acidimicrobiaceae bacterium]
MPEVLCPGCGTESHFDQLRRDSSEFCRVCDYPLFWVRTTAFALDQIDTDGENGLRRLPGTAGRVAAASLFCPSCTEPNPVAAVLCIRCGSDLHPRKVEPPPPPPPEPEPEPVVLVVAPPSRWPWILLALAVLILVISLIALAVV